MKKTLFLVLIIPLVSFTLPPDTIEKEFKTSMGKQLSMELKTGGSVDIKGWNKDVVSVKVFLSERDAENCKVEFNETSSGVQIESKYRSERRNNSSRLKFEIMVPERYDVSLETMGGAVSIQNVEGNIEGETMGGELDLHKLKGTLDLTTMGGEITLRNSDVDGRVKTMGGEVLVEDVTGDVKATSMGGEVTHRNVKRRSGEVRGTAVDITTMGGDINVDDAPLGANVHTMGGNIHIRSAAKFAKAKTMGGNIEIDAVDGSVNATTMGGDVTVRMVGDPSQGERDVEIESMGGDITLTVPPTLSMDFDITLTYTENRRGRYRIISDFEMNQEETDEWDRDDGTPRKHIYGTGTVAGAKHKIKIKTINGNIYLKKG
jgi:hypothetical protein